MPNKYYCWWRVEDHFKPLSKIREVKMICASKCPVTITTDEKVKTVSNPFLKIGEVEMKLEVCPVKITITNEEANIIGKLFCFYD